MFGKQVDISFNVYNLFDKRYYDPAPASLNFIGDYQMTGRSFFGACQPEILIKERSTYENRSMDKFEV